MKKNRFTIETSKSANKINYQENNTTTTEAISNRRSVRRQIVRYSGLIESSQSLLNSFIVYSIWMFDFGLSFRFRWTGNAMDIYLSSAFGSLHVVFCSLFFHSSSLLQSKTASVDVINNIFFFFCFSWFGLQHFSLCSNKENIFKYFWRHTIVITTFIYKLRPQCRAFIKFIHNMFYSKEFEWPKTFNQENREKKKIKEIKEINEPSNHQPSTTI